MPDEKDHSRIPELDGVRGVAVLLVMAFHFLWFPLGFGLWSAQGEGFAGRCLRLLVLSGWAGVDLFFVLSGFLITGILWDAKDSPTYFRKFYLRRVLRIFPAYYLVFGLGSWVLPLLAPRMLRGTDPAYPAWLLTYTSNVLLANHGWKSIPLPFQHFWSLAIEEQFYLLWPFLLSLFSRRQALIACVAVLLVCPVLRLMLVLGGNPLPAYVMTYCRLDSLAAGGLLALLIRGSEGAAVLEWRGFRWVAAAAGAVLLVLFIVRSGLRLTDPVVATLGFSMLAALFASVVGACVSPAHAGFTSRLFSSAVLRWFGKYSYALYLVHQPVCLFLITTGAMAVLLQGPAASSLLMLFGVPLAVSVLLALISWYGCEMWFLRLKTRLAL